MSSLSGWFKPKEHPRNPITTAHRPSPRNPYHHHPTTFSVLSLANDHPSVPAGAGGRGHPGGGAVRHDPHHPWGQAACHDRRPTVGSRPSAVTVDIPPLISWHANLLLSFDASVQGQKINQKPLWNNNGRRWPPQDSYARVEVNLKGIQQNIFLLVRHSEMAIVFWTGADIIVSCKIFNAHRFQK